MKGAKLGISCLLFTILGAMLGGPVQAEDADTPFSKSCAHYRSGTDFVRQAGYYCLKQPNVKSCDRRIPEYFDRCNFEGNFKRISSKVHTDMLIMLLMGKAPELVKTRNPSKSGTARRAGLY